MATTSRIASALFRRSANVFHRNAPVKFIRPSRSFSCCRVLFSGRKYTEKHEWVQMDGNIGTVGISDFAQDALGDIVYAQLPDVGAEFEQNDECGALESVKAASDIYSPVSGKVTAKNTLAEEKPEIINKSCYDEGWLFKIELSKQEEVDELMGEEAYKDFLQSQN